MKRIKKHNSIPGEVLQYATLMVFKTQVDKAPRKLLSSQHWPFLELEVGLEIFHGAFQCTVILFATYIRLCNHLHLFVHADTLSASA